MTAGKLSAVIGGIAGHALAFLCWLALFETFHFDALKFWVNLILPFGAVLLGTIGGLGFWLGARVMRQGSTPDLRVAAVLIAVATAFLIRYCGYRALEFGGVPVHTVIGFGEYLQATLGHARMDFSHASHAIGGVEIGAFGYVMEFLQTAAYAATSYAIVATRPRAVRCEPCRQFMHDRDAGAILRNDPSQFRALHETLPHQGASRLATLRMTPSDDDGPITGAVKLHWRLWECPTCSAAALAESGTLYNGQHFAPVAALGQQIRFDRRQVASPPPEPAAPRPSGFGRRVIP